MMFDIVNNVAKGYQKWLKIYKKIKNIKKWKKKY